MVIEILRCILELNFGVGNSDNMALIKENFDGVLHSCLKIKQLWGKGCWAQQMVTHRKTQLSLSYFFVEGWRDFEEHNNPLLSHGSHIPRIYLFWQMDRKPVAPKASSRNSLKIDGWSSLTMYHIRFLVAFEHDPIYITWNLEIKMLMCVPHFQCHKHFFTACRHP